MMNTSQIIEHMCSHVEAAISRFNMFDKQETVAVAFSGGKDSLALLWILKELGYKVVPIAIKVWPNFDQETINSVSAQVGFEPLFVDVRKETQQQVELVQLKKNLGVVDTITKRIQTSGVMGDISPCTSCYNLKVQFLASTCERLGIKTVVFGHHMTDAASSLLKMAAMVIDYEAESAKPFEHVRFTNLCKEWLETFTSPTFASSLLCEKIEKLVASGIVSSDEPPKQFLRANNASQNIVRPLIGLWESDLVTLRDAMGWQTCGSGCGHGFSELVKTPRELIQHILLNHAANECREKLAEWVHQGLTSEGYAVRNTRNERHTILPGYRPTTVKY